MLVTNCISIDKDRTAGRVNNCAKGYIRPLPTETDEYLNCDYTGVAEKDLAKAKVLFPTVASVIGRGGRANVTLDANFYELGGNSLNSIYTVTKLKDQGYEIGITEFITASSLEEVLDRMRSSTDDEPLEKNTNQPENYYELLDDSHKENAIEYVVCSCKFISNFGIVYTDSSFGGLDGKR